MIRYAITETDLLTAIEAEKPRWLARARERTDRFIAAGEYNESSGIWSEIKRVYLHLQHDKCAYCERQLATAEDGGTIEHDVEHYRPKNTVPEWPTASGDPLENGYYWLAYHPLNYCTSCKKCNSPLKSNYFPIAAERGPAEADPATLHETEKPFLIYPLGDLDEDPETLIRFVGIIPIPVKQNGPRRRRAKVTIKFFRLDTREELFRERARCLVALDSALWILEQNPPPDREAKAQRDIRRLTSSESPHANCVRSACLMYQEQPLEMRELFDAARDFLDSE